MTAEKKSYFLKLNPPRTTFMSDMTDEEREIMQKHVSYWAPYVNGPVFDPKGGYGIAVARVDEDEQLNELIKNDPGNGLNAYEIYQMRAVIKQ